MTRLLLIACIAASAGIHAALAPSHGLSFGAAAVLLAAAAAAVALRPGRPAALAAATLLLGLLAAYGFRHGASGDGTAAVTKAVEAVGVAFAAGLATAGTARRPERAAALVAAVLVAALAATVTPTAGHEHAPGVAVHGH